MRSGNQQPRTWASIARPVEKERASIARPVEEGRVGFGRTVEEYPPKVTGHTIHVKPKQAGNKGGKETDLMVVRNNGGPIAKDCLLISMAQGEAMAGIPEAQRFFKGEFRAIREKMIEEFKKQNPDIQCKLAQSFIREDVGLQLRARHRNQAFHGIRTETLTAELIRMFILSRGRRLYNLVFFMEVKEGKGRRTFTPNIVTDPLDIDLPCLFVVHYPSRHHFEALVPDPNYNVVLRDIELSHEDPGMQEAIKASLQSTQPDRGLEQAIAASIDTEQQQADTCQFTSECMSSSSSDSALDLESRIEKYTARVQSLQEQIRKRCLHEPKATKRQQADPRAFTSECVSTSNSESDLDRQIETLAAHVQYLQENIRQWHLYEQRLQDELEAQRLHDQFEQEQADAEYARRLAASD